MTMDIADAVQGHERQTREGEHPGRTLASNVFERLRHDILECRLRPGTRLPFADLRLRYGVGTSPLREALMNHPWRLKKAVTYLFDWIATMLRELLHPHPKVPINTG